MLNKICWETVLEDIQLYNFSLRKIAAATTVPLSTLHYAKNGGDLATTAGLAVIKLWSELTEKNYSELPTKPAEVQDPDTI